MLFITAHLSEVSLAQTTAKSRTPDSRTATHDWRYNLHGCLAILVRAMPPNAILLRLLLYHAHLSLGKASWDPTMWFPNVDPDPNKALSFITIP